MLIRGFKFGGLGRNRTADTRIFNFLNTCAAGFGPDTDLPSVMGGIQKSSIRSTKGLATSEQFLPIWSRKTAPTSSRKPDIFRSHILFLLLDKYLLAHIANLTDVTIKNLRKNTASFFCMSSYKRVPRKTRESLELATRQGAHWLNHGRLLEPMGHIPSAEAEANYRRQVAKPVQA